MTHLNWPITLAHDLQLDPPTAFAQRDAIIVAGDDGPGYILGVVVVWIRVGEGIGRGDGEEAPVQGLFKIAVIATDRVLNGDEIGPRGKGSFDLYFGDGGRDGGQDMAAAEHGFADGHEVGHRMVTIAD